MGITAGHLTPLVEKGKGDSHFYGAWKGGSSKSGGGPMDAEERATAAASSGDLQRLSDLLLKQPEGPLITAADEAAGRPARFGFSELRGPDKKFIPYGSKVEVKNEKGKGGVLGVLHSGDKGRFTVVTSKGEALTLTDGARIRAYSPSPSFKAWNAKYGMLAGMALWSTPTMKEAYWDDAAGPDWRLTTGDYIALGIAEKGKDDHFYGSWAGGSKAAGGGPDKNRDGKPDADGGAPKGPKLGPQSGGAPKGATIPTGTDSKGNVDFGAVQSKPPTAGGPFDPTKGRPTQQLFGALRKVAKAKGTETSQQKLNRLMADAQKRIPVGATIKNSRGTARWNGLAWVYGQGD